MRRVAGFPTYITHGLCPKRSRVAPWICASLRFLRNERGEGGRERKRVEKRDEVAEWNEKILEGRRTKEWRKEEGGRKEGKSWYHPNSGEERA